jgi:[ribosomal protein S5]-alanine N-acetyltransferase
MISNKLFGAFPTLSSQRMLLRQITEDDFEDVYNLYADERVFTFCGMLNKTNKAVILSSIDHFDRDFRQRKRIKWGIALKENEEKVVGIIEALDYISHINQITVGYFIHPDFWNRGIASEALRILVYFLFEDVGINRIQAEVMPRNIYSKRVLLKNGFQLEGTLRQATLWVGKGLIDLELYSILASDYAELKKARALEAPK